MSYVATLARAAWGEEAFSTEGVSAENEMSVVQFARLANNKILLTADAGREALTEAIRFAPKAGLDLPGIERFQVPHHGSRRNVSSELLDQLLGPRLPAQPLPGQERFTALISSAKEDEAHPRKAVVRAMIHRGAKALATEGVSILSFQNAPPRPGWGPVSGLAYPSDQESD
jgi:beta-lactamase superfamily II metal-dependent hydrolase